MRPGRVVALVVGCLLVLPGIAMLLAGSALGIGYLVQRDDDGYFDVTLDRLETDTVAVTAEDLTFFSDPGTPDQIIDELDADVRLRATAAASGQATFIGIADEADLDIYLSGVAHDELTDLTNDLEPVYRSRSGEATVPPPTAQDFWVASASGLGTQELVWEATSGRWAAVVMNADGSPGVATDLSVGARAGFLGPLAIILIGIGTFLTTAAVTLLVVGASGAQAETQEVSGLAQPLAADVPTPSPVHLSAQLDPQLSQWQWLVKWFLAIPHIIVLVFLGIAFGVLTLVAWFAILFTGRYPRGIFDFNVGVLRWGWRVSYYAGTGGIGTDQYPPFSLRAEPGDPAAFDIDYPDHLSRGLIFVKWLLAVPHLIVVGLLAGGTIQGSGDAGNATYVGGLLGILVLVAGVMLLFSNKYPTALFDLIVGLNRWIYRVVAYVALMTDQYPPFRLDQGGEEPKPPPPPSNPTLFDQPGLDLGAPDSEFEPAS